MNAKQVQTTDRNRHFTPAYLKAMRSPSISHGSFRWVDPEPRFKGRGGQQAGERVRGDRIGHGYAILYAAAAQAKGWETTVSWTTPRSREKVSVPPFRSTEDALAWIEEMQTDMLLGGEAKRVLAHVRKYFDEREG